VVGNLAANPAWGRKSAPEAHHFLTYINIHPTFHLYLYKNAVKISII